MAESGKAPYFFALILLLAVLGVYLPGLGNELLFDDVRLTEGSIFGLYGNVLEIKQRMLSYGSFVWIDHLAGAGWWKQRIFNIGLHLGVVAATYALLKSLLLRTQFPQDIQEQQHFAASRNAALRVGVALFALNPVAVYAVAYLIQRSMVMATLFAVLACWAFVRGLDTRRVVWYAVALVSYVLAVLSKEHAIMTAAMAVPLYVYVRRPSGKHVAIMVAGALLLLALAVGVLLHFRGDLVGRLFDAQSVAFAEQLEAVRPGVTQQIYPLSILNQAGLFFAYGLLWAVPYVGWMSIDLRPAFPLGFMSPWHLLGAVAYIALLAGCIWLVLRRTGALSLAALCLLFPMLWFATEFATVWIQDPFVLYRSYLWAVALPGLLAIALAGFKPRTIYVVGAVLGLLFGALALERNQSLRDEHTAWSDAAEKIDLQAPANAVGRSRPFLNLGAYYLRKGFADEAERAFSTAAALGDRGELGRSTRFNAGVALQQKKKHAEALKAFASAEALGYSDLPLYYHRGESQFALNQFVPAFESFSIALQKVAKDKSNQNTEPTIRLRRAEAAVAALQFDAAAADFRTLLQTDAHNPRFVQGLAMALLGKGNGKEATALMEELVSHKPSAAAYYGRAMVYHSTGRLPDALKDLDQAIQLDPRNPQYRQVREKIAAAPAKR